MGIRKGSTNKWESQSFPKSQFGGGSRIDGVKSLGSQSDCDFTILIETFNFKHELQYNRGIVECVLLEKKEGRGKNLRK